MQKCQGESMKLTQLQDSLLGAFVERTHFSLFELTHGYRRLRSIDKLMEATTKARVLGKSLDRVIDEMEQN